MWQAIRAWLATHVEPQEMRETGSTRGCDLWARENHMEIYEAAYGQARVEGREEPLGAYRMAKWELWGRLEEDDRKP